MQAKGIKTLDMTTPPADAYRALIRANGKAQGWQPSEDLIKYYELLVSVMPENPQGHSVLGFCYYRQGLKDKAYEQFQKSCMLDPHSFWGCQDWAVMALQAGQYSDAEKLFSLGLNADPRYTLRELYSSKVYFDILSSDHSYNPVVSLQEGYTRAAKALYSLKNKIPLQAAGIDAQIKIL